MANMTDAAFDALRRTADAVTKESGGTFLALAGVEWSTNSAGNHVTILGASQVPRTTRGAFDRLYEDFLPARTAANERPIVILNHPRTFRHHQEALNGSWDQIYGVDLLDIPSAAERSYKFNDFGIDDYEPLRSIRQRWIDGVDMPDESVVVETLANLGTAAAPFVRAIEVTVARGKELAGEDPQNPSLTTAEDGSAERFTKVHSDWDYYLRHGMRLAPVASHDNHFANWGAGHSSRTAVIAPRLDALAFADALAARAIYASEDENLELRYYADDRVRSGGSLRTLGDKVQLQVHLQDTDFDGPFRARVYFGTVGGAEVSPVVERDLAGEQWHALEISLPSMGLHFAYIEVHEVGPDRMAWSAPIWIERLD
jgi:hypothetical protein